MTVQCSVSAADEWRFLSAVRCILYSNLSSVVVSQRLQLWLLLSFSLLSHYTCYPTFVKDRLTRACDRLKQERARAREERIRHTNEQIARIKQRQRETESERELWNQLQPYIITVTSVAVALVGYLIYQYLT